MPLSLSPWGCKQPMVQAGGVAPPRWDFGLFSPEARGDLPWPWRFQSPASYGDNRPLTTRQVSLYLQPWGFCLVAEQYEGAMLSRCAAGEVTVCDGGGGSTSVFESCSVLLRTNALPGAARKFMAVPAFESLRASEQQRQNCHQFPPSPLSQNVLSRREPSRQLPPR